MIADHLTCPAGRLASAPDHRRRDGRPPRRTLAVALAVLAAASLSCGDGPVDVEETDDGAIGPEGGTFSTADGAVTLVVPPGALEESHAITATPTSAAGSLPVIAGTAWELGPDGIQFAEPAELTIRYDPAAFSGDPADLRIVQVLEDAGELELAVHVGHDEAAGTVTGAVRHLSSWGVGVCANCASPPVLSAEYLGPTEGVELSWPLSTHWGWVRIYRAALRQCEPGETSGEFGPYTCVSSSAEVLLPPPLCVAPDTAPDGRPCRFALHTHAPGAWGGITDRSLGSRGAVFWYLARGGFDGDPIRAWSWPPRQATHFGTPDPPEVPANFTATAVSDSAIQLTWQPTPTASGYELDVFLDGAWDGQTLPYSDYAFLHERLEPNTQYQYRIRSVNEHGSSAYAFANATTGNVAGPGCEDFALAFDGLTADTIAVVPGQAGQVGILVENRAPGFTDPVALMLTTGATGDQPIDVLYQHAFAPNPVPFLNGDVEYSTLSFTARLNDLSVGETFDIDVTGASPSHELVPPEDWCRLPVTFAVTGS